MIKSIERKKGANIIEVWYAEEKVADKGIIRYREALKPIMADSREKRTLFTDLLQDEEEIIGRFSKNCRYEIRRAAKEAIDIRFFDENAAEEIDGFIQFFERFWIEKGVYGQDYSKQKRELERYARDNRLVITRADIAGEPVVYHTYIIDERIVRLYQSASIFRAEGAVSAQLAGMANRYLHKEDIIKFKKLGKKIYDWGGAGLREEVASITKFKESFGGKEVFLYEGEEIKGISAGLYRIAVKILGIFCK